MLVGVAGFEPATPSSRTKPEAGRSFKNQRFSSRSRTFVRIRFARSCGRTCGRRTIGGLKPRYPPGALVMKLAINLFLITMVTGFVEAYISRGDMVATSPSSGPSSIRGNSAG